MFPEPGYQSKKSSQVGIDPLMGFDLLEYRFYLFKRVDHPQTPRRLIDGETVPC